MSTLCQAQTVDRCHCHTLYDMSVCDVLSRDVTVLQVMSPVVSHSEAGFSEYRPNFPPKASLFCYKHFDSLDLWILGCSTENVTGTRDVHLT